MSVYWRASFRNVSGYCEGREFNPPSAVQSTWQMPYVSWFRRCKNTLSTPEAQQGQWCFGFVLVDHHNFSDQWPTDSLEKKWMWRIRLSCIWASVFHTEMTSHLCSRSESLLCHPLYWGGLSPWLSQVFLRCCRPPLVIKGGSGISSNWMKVYSWENIKIYKWQMFHCHVWLPKGNCSVSIVESPVLMVAWVV